MDIELTGDQKNVLSEYVLSEMKRRDRSERELSEEIGLSYSTLQKWRRQKISTLSADSQLRLEQYRRSQNQPPYKVADWLSPSPQSDAGHSHSWEDNLRGQLRSLYAQVEQVLGAIATLERSIPVEFDRKEVCRTVFGQMVRSLLDQKQCTLEQFAAIAGIDVVELRRSLNEKPTRDALEAIARGLNGLYGQPIWDGESLGEIADRSERVKDVNSNCECS